MSLSVNANLNVLYPPTPAVPVQLQDTNVSAALQPGTSDVADLSEHTNTEPALSNRAATNASTLAAYEISQPSTLIVEHSAPEKSDRSSSASSEAVSASINVELTALIKAAEQGEAEAQFELAIMYKFGKSVYKDKEKAFEWFKKAADQNYSRAQYQLGKMYRKGGVVEKNKEKSFEYFYKAALDNDREAQHSLGEMYLTGEGVKKNKEKASEWFLKSAEQGQSEAQHSLGQMYWTGEGVKKNKEKASEWFLKSAKQGQSEAQFKVGIMYKSGSGVKQDKEKAFEWFHNASSNGSTSAKYQLSQAYRSGEGVAQDLSLAAYFMLDYSRTARFDFLKTIDICELIKYLPDILKKYPKLNKSKFIEFSSDALLTKENISDLTGFIKANTRIKSLKISLERKSQKDEVTAALEEALEFNTELIKLEVSYRDHFKYESSSEESSSDSESYKILNQTKVLLAQNRTIVELRQYVLDHPLINTVDIPTDVIKILEKQIIVSYLKSGQTKEATKKAIDEFLIIASTTALAKDSKLN